MGLLHGQSKRLLSLAPTVHSAIASQTFSTMSNTCHEPESFRRLKKKKPNYLKYHKKANSAVLNETHLHFFSSSVSEHYLRGRFAQFIYFGFLTVQGDNSQQYNFPPVPKPLKCTQELISILSSAEAQYLPGSQ